MTDNKVAAQASAHGAAVLLTEAESRYRLIAEHASDIVFATARDGVLLWMSPSASTVMGWDPTAMTGHRMREWLHPDDLAGWTPEVIAGFEAAGRVTYEGRWRRADGGWRWVAVTTRIVHDADGEVAGWVGSARDIEADVASREELAESRRRYELMVHNAADVIVVIRGGSVEWVSPSIHAALGYDHESFVGMAPEEVIHPDDIASMATRRARVLAGKPSIVRSRFRHADGRWVWMEAHGFLVQDETPLRGAMVAVWRVVDDQVALEGQLAHNAIHDPLTGLHNRTWLVDAIGGDLRAARRAGEPLAVLYVDLDDFKVVNDSLGHAAGDSLLKAIGQRIAGAVRPEDRVGRLGGDEFLVLARGWGQASEVRALADRVASACSRPKRVDHHELNPTVSIGIALSDEASTSASLLREADTALHQAKARGRGCSVLFDPTMMAEVVHRFVTGSELRAAIRGRELVVHYQPIVRLSDHRVVGHEALVRWQHPSRGLLAPGWFLPVAESDGLIADLDDLVLDDVCGLLADHPDLPGPISVNCSPVEIATPGWRDRFLGHLERRGVGPHRIVLEITETAVLSSAEDVRADLQRLRDVGVGVHLDDFGTGYSSLSLLGDLPVSGVKQDLSFTRRLVEEEHIARLSRGVAGLAQALGLIGIAEGVESADQARMVTELGWTHAQGYYFGRPTDVPAATVIAH